MQPSSKLRQRISLLCKRRGAEAIPIENSVNVGLPDLLILNGSQQIWVELKVGADKLTRTQSARCYKLNAWVLYFKKDTYWLAKVKTTGGFTNMFVEPEYNSESLEQTLDFLFSKGSQDVSEIFKDCDDHRAGASPEFGHGGVD